MTMKLMRQGKPTQRIFKEPGEIVITEGVQNSVSANEVIKAIERHYDGDWGDIDANDWKANDEAAQFDRRILSSYTSKCGVTFWIITEWDRNVTTVLLPSEY